MRSEHRALAVIGCDVALRLHLPIDKSPIHYLVDSQALISLSEMRHGIANRNKTTWSNTDARLNSEEFYEPGINHQVSTHEMGGRSV